MALGDQRAVPAAAVLLGSGTSSPPATRLRRRASVSSISASRPATSRLVGQQRAQHPAEPDRLVGQLGADRGVARAGEVALVEDEVDDGQHRRRAARRGRRPTAPGRGCCAPLILLLGPGDPLGHRRLRDEERRGDLGDGQPAEQAQGERHPGLRRERRVAAGEDQPEPVVLDRAGRLVGGVVVDHQGRLVLGVALGLAADPVDGPVAGGGGQPAARVGRHAVDAASARRRPGAPRRPPPRRRRCRRSGGSARRRPGRTPRGRSARSRRWGPVTRLEARPGRAAPRPCPAGRRALGGPRQRRVEVGGLDDPEAAEPLLGLGERAVGDDRLARRCCRRWSPARSASVRRRTPTRPRPAASG